MLRIRAGSPQPIYMQIVDGLSQAISRGEFKPGDGLPSIRELAAELVVNPNTVARAFNELVRLGVVVAQPGRGYLVIVRELVFTDAECQRRLAAPAQVLAAAAQRLGAPFTAARTALETAWQHEPINPDGPLP